jgi:hypothetical protein
MVKLSAKYLSAWLISLLLSVIGAVLFFAPAIHVLSCIKKHDDSGEAEIFFVSFFAQNGLFILHSISVLVSFLAFSIALSSLFKEKEKIILTVFTIAVSLVVIFTYIAGYDAMFQIADWFWHD